MGSLQAACSHSPQNPASVFLGIMTSESLTRISYFGAGPLVKQIDNESGALAD
jgi:hypothetical protein